MRERTEVLAGRFTKREAKIIARLAEAEKINVATYVRAAVLTSAVLDGDLEAMRLVGGYAVKALAEKGARMLRDEELRLETA